MQEMRVKDIEGLFSWAHMLVNEEAYVFPECDAQMNFFGHGDAAYLVVETDISAEEITQYVLTSEQEEQQNQAVWFVFDFLKTCDYSLGKLLHWLQQAEFSAEGNVCANGLIIQKSKIALRHR